MYAKEVDETREAVLLRLSSMVNFNQMNDEDVEATLLTENVIFSENDNEKIDKKNPLNSSNEIEIKNTAVTPEGYIISEDCYIRCRPIYEKLRREKVPISDIGCLLCGERRARFNVDLNFGVCDSCVSLSNQQELAAQKSYNLLNRAPVLPDKISSHLYIGSKESSINFDVLESLGIKRILVCCSNLEEYFPGTDDDRKIRYHRLPLADSLDQNLLNYMPSALAFMADGERNDEKVLVHCNAGVSRSGITVIMYLMATVFNDPNESTESRFDKAYTYAKQKRSIIHPNSNFVNQIRGG